MSHRTIKLDHVTISTGNTKLGELPNVSLSPCKGCAKGVPCKKQCYAMKAYRCYPSVRKSWDRNLRSARKNLVGYFCDIDRFLCSHKPRFFRWHVSGDILDQRYLRLMMYIAELHPKTRFLAFTKQHELNYSYCPDNLQIVFSMWPGWGNTIKPWPRAWYQDGTETRVPRNAIHCPGNCEACGMCWSLDDIGRDVVFMKH